MKKKAKQILSAALLVLAAMSSLSADNIKHKFVATDESGHQLIYVDETNPENDWTLPLDGNRDVQITKDGKVLVSVPTGYREHDLKTGEMLKEIKIGNNIQSIVRLDSGHTFLANKQGIIELSKDDKKIAEHKINMSGFFRLLRINKDGNFLYTSAVTKVKELKPGGKTIKEIDLTKITPKSKKPYFIEELANGQHLISTGYGATILLVDKEWNLIKSYGSGCKEKGIETHFFADAQQLKNGNIIIAHWTGHGRKDSEKAPQAIEFDKDGNIVWTWHDPKRAGSLHGIEVVE